MEPVVSDLEKKHGEKIDVVIVDVYENMEQALEYKVRVVPTMFLLDGSGEVLERIEGYMNLEQLESMLEQHGIL
ncbi:MAG: thioredoxin family protein [Thermovirgaceae bacterium]